MRRSRRTYTLAMGEWTAGNHDQAGHRSERSHSVRVEFMHAMYMACTSFPSDGGGVELPVCVH